MPGRGGIDLIRQIRLRDPGGPHRRLHDAPKRGVRPSGVPGRCAGPTLPKSSKPILLIHAIKEVASRCGARSISPDVSEELALAKRWRTTRPALASLSPREFEILRHILDARSTAEIAAALNLSPKTVSNYHYLIRQKLGVASDVELIYFGLRKRLVAPLGAALMRPIIHESG